ncbi:MAG: flippase activity-associated protein Agl23 [Pseudomonadota bacterium]
MEIKRQDLRYLVAFGFCFAFLLSSRFTVLAEKPYHHDESLYATEAWRWATQGIYKFNPMLHGPFLFHVHALLFLILPINDFTGRLPVVMAGIGLALFALSFVQRTGWLSAVVWLALISFSPIFCYFSRFLGMDLPMTFLATGFLVFALRTWEQHSVKYLYLTAFFFVSLVCTKLNWLFYFFSFGTFLLARPLWAEEKYLEILRSGVQTGRKFAKGFGKHWYGVGALVVGIFCALNSSLGKNWGGILDALGRTMIPYWINQHKIERVGGPFDYYFPLVATYELPLFLGILWAILHILRVSKRVRRVFLTWTTASIAVLLFLAASWSLLGGPLNKVLHFKNAFQPALFTFEIGLWLALMKYHLKEGEDFAAFAAHWGMTSLLLYSMAGEKVPWLATNVILPWCFYFAVVIPPLFLDWMTRPVSRAALGFIIIVVFAWQGVITMRACVDLSANPRERLVYTHSSWEMVDLVERIHHMARATGEGLDLNIQVNGDGVWPLQWYLRDYKHWFWPEINPAQHPEIVIESWDKKDALEAKLGPGFAIERVRLRVWWVPDPAKATFVDCVKYYFTRVIFSPTGSTDIAVFIKGTLLNEWRSFAPTRVIRPTF